MSLISFTNKGFFCEQADIYIDPTQKVNRALITHGHADHARRGMSQYICAQPCLPVLKTRLGKQNIHGKPFGETFQVNGVKISFHPAAHVLGSAQIRLEYKGEVWVISGDYKTENDGISGAFEVVPCHHFVTETTFGLPVYKWEDQYHVYSEINQWWQENQDNGRASVMQAYSLGKAQRILKHLNRNIGRVFVHPTIAKMNEAYRHGGADPGLCFNLDGIKEEDRSQSIFVLPSINPSNDWMKRLQDPAFAAASGWFAIRNSGRRRNLDKCFVLSDHADWTGLNRTIDETGAENIYVTHGYEKEMMRWLSEKGKNAQMVSHA